MKNKILVLLGLFVLPAVLMAGVANAQSFRSGDNVNISANEVVSKTLFAAGQSIDIAGDVEGDIFCAGQNIQISGDVSGDVICTGQTIRISGSVEGDVRLAGQTVTVDGRVRDGLSVAAQSFTLQSDARVGRDAQVMAQDASFNGQVQRDLAIASSSAVISDRVGRDVTATLDSLRLSSNAQVGGNVKYSSENMADVAEGAVISGDTIRSEPKPKAQSRQSRGEFFALSFSFAIYAILSMLLVSLAVVLLFPQALRETSRWALESPGKTLLIGLLALLIVPVVIISLIITVIGIPLAILLGLLWMLVMFLSGPFAAYYVGRLIFRDNPKNPIVIMLVGSFVLLILYFVPFIGLLAAMLVLWFGTGMILSELMHRTPRPDYNHRNVGVEKEPAKKPVKKTRTTKSKK